MGGVSVGWRSRKQPIVQRRCLPPRRLLQMPSRLRLLLCALLALALLTPAAAQAAGTPDISVAVSSRSVLYGDAVPVAVTATNPPGTYGYNLSYRVVLPAGVSYAGGASVAPQVIADQPAAGQTTLLFINVSDLSPNSSRALAFDLNYSQAIYDVGSTFPVTAQAFVNSDARFVPKFDAAGAPAGGATGSAGPASGTQTINAIKVTKDEPSAEGEILRGVHDHQVVYTVGVENNSVHSTTGTTLDDYLPAGLEFLGCGTGADDHTTDAPTNPGSAQEYPGSGPISIASLGGCVDPISVDTESVDPDGAGPLPSGVYTHVVWNVGTLAPNETRSFPYRAAVPLRANTTTFTGTRPTAASGGQVANLDNNSGPEIADETALTNLARADGSYQGGTPVPVSDNATITRTAEDWLVHKTASASALEEGAITTWTLDFASSEYRYADDATVTDTLPDGFCPLDATNRTSGNDGADSECDPSGGNVPSAPYKTADENADGTWTLTWDVTVLAHLGHTGVNDTFTITFPTRTRASYQSSFLPDGPILTRDIAENAVRTDATQFIRCTAPGTADCSTPGPKLSHDVPDGAAIDDLSAARQTATDPVIDKQVAASGPDCSVASYVDTVPHYHPGDRVCWWVRVTFPSAVDTTPQAIADFLPAGAAYEPGSEAPGAGDNVVSSLDASAAASDKVLRWTVSGTSVPSGNKVFSRVFSTIAQPPGTPATGDITGNLLKFSSTDTPGVSTSLRDEADYVLDTPVVGLTKGVASVVRGGSTVVGPLGPDNDNIAVQGGDQVTYRVDVTNSGAQDASAVMIRDLLPADYDCPLTPGPVSDGGACVDGGLASDQVQWTLPTLAAGATTTLTYTLTVPSDVGPGRVLVNHAGVRQYDGATNLGGTYTYTPASNIDPSDPATPNAPAADDTSDVHTADAGVVKARDTEITETGNTNAQATIGEEITYTLTATVPAGTTLHGTAQLTDTVDSATRQPYVGGSATATLNGGALPGGFTLDTSGTTPRVVFPTDYANAAGSGDDVLVLTFRTKVADVAGNTRTSGNLTNQGALSWTDPAAGGAQSRPSATLTTQVVEPLIAQAKIDDKNPARAAPGDVITYTVTTTNPTAPGRVSTAHDLVTSDAVPVGLTPIGVAPGNAALSDGDAVPGSGGATWHTGTRTITKPVTTLVPGGSAAFSYRVKVDDPGVGGATKVNTVTTTATSLGAPADADGERTSGTGYSAAKSDTITLVGATITKSASPTTATIGAPITYTLRVTIPSSLALFDVTAVDVLPDSLDFDGYGTETCISGCPLVNPINHYTPVVAGTTRIAWDFGDFAAPLATPQVIELTYTAHVRATHRTGGAAVVVGQTPTNSATVASDRTNIGGPFDATTIPTTFDDTSTVVTAPVTVIEPKLTIDKQVKVGGGAFVDGPATARSDSGLTYRVVVKNTGNAPAYDVTVGDQPDAELTNVTPATVAGVTVTDGWTAGDPDLTWQIAGPIAAGDSVTLTYTADLVAASGLHDAQNIDNTAAIPHYFGVAAATRTANPSTVYKDYTNGGSDATRVVLDFPAFTIVKNVGASGGAKTGTAEVGQDFTWRLTVTNTSGTAAASAVHVTDTLPPNWEYLASSATLAPGGPQEPAITAHATGDELDWNAGALAAGASATVTFVARPLPDAATTPGTGSQANVNSAEVTSATDEAGNAGNADGAYGSAPDTATATLHLPDLAIVKTPDHGAATAGATSSFTLAVTNNGNGTARNADVADVLPDGLSYTAGDATASPSAGFTEASVAAGPGAGETTVHWTVATLAAGATVTVTVPVTVGHDVADGTTLTNTGRASSDEVPTPVSDTGSLDVSARADLSIAKTGAADYTAGTDYVWHLRVRNLGPSDAQAASVSDVLPLGTTFVSADAPCTEAAGTVTCALGTVAAGFDHTYDVTVAVDPGVTAAPLSNTATVSTTTTDPVPGNDASTSDATPSALADVSVTKAASPSAILKNGQTTFTMVVHNAGPSVARSVTLGDPMPAGLTAVSATGPGCAVAGGAVTCAPGDMAVGADALVTVVATGTVNGPWTNTATVATTTDEPIGGGDPDSASAPVIVGPVADLRLAKTAPATVAAGGSLTWTVSVTNAGPDPATGVKIVDPLPAGTAFASAGPGCAEAAGTVTCDVGALAVGDHADRTITATVPVALADQTLLNTATVASDQGDDHPADDTASASTLVGPSVDLGVVKTGPASAPAGGQIAWTIVATDHGPSAATDVTVTDTLPDGVTLVSATPTQGACTAAGATVTCALGGLASGGAAQVQLVGGIAADRQGAVITNGAAITGDQPDPVASNDRSSATTTVGPPATTGPNLTLRKSVLGDATPRLGVALRYALDVTNAGDAAATGVVVTDTLPANLEFVSASIPGGSCKDADAVVRCSVTTLAAGETRRATVTTRPITPGPVRNTASVLSAGADARPVDNVASAGTSVTAPRARLRLVKTTTRRSPVRPGQHIHYRLRVTNVSHQAAAGVVVCDTLPSALVTVSAPGAKFRNGRPCWTIGMLRAGHGRSFRLTARLTSSAQAGRVRNVASVTARNAGGRRAAAMVTAAAQQVKAARGGGVTG